MARRLIVILVLCMLAGSGSVVADFNPRALALGGAYTADSETDLMFANPALAGERGFVFTGFAGGSGDNLVYAVDMLSNSTLDMPRETVSLDIIAGGALGIGSVGVNISTTAKADADFASEYEGSGTGEAQAEVGVSLARTLVNPPLKLGALTVGVKGYRVQSIAVEMSAQGSTGSQQVVEDRVETNGYGLDIGVRAKVTDIVSVGFVTDNLYKTVDAKAYRIEREYSNGELIAETRQEGPDPAVSKGEFGWRIGVAVRPPLLGLLGVADYDSEGTLRLGVEKTLVFKALSLRVGQVLPAGGEQHFSAGLGVNLGPLHCDVAKELGGTGRLVASVSAVF